MTTEDKPRDTSPPATPAATSLDPTTLDPTRIPSQTELIGTVLSGRYAIESELKRGGMGAVFLARDQQLHSRTTVIKVLLDEAYQSEYVVQKFRQEVEALSRIDHPGIVGIIDAGELPNGRPFIAMQYVEGVTLRSVMSPEGMNLERIADLIKQIGRALAAAHNRGIFHRDLKPDNIMVQDLGHGEEQVKIIDFGIAKIKDSVVAPSTSLNLSPGTVAYMAPEQLSGRPITAATDIFALGAIAYEMVTGRKPFNPETAFELLQMQQTGVRVKPADLRPSLPLEAQEMILKALSFNPGDRYKSPRDFGDNLARAMAQNIGESKSERADPDALPPTQLSNPSSEETPLARPAAGRATPTMQASFQDAERINPSATELGFGRATAPHRSRRTGLWLALAIVLIAAPGITGWYFMRSKNTGGGAGDSAARPERVLSYGLTVQKMREGHAYQDPFDSSGQEIFENGWKFRMNLSSAQEGYLYLLNEGPAANGATTYNVLFPEPKTNANSPRVTAEQKLQTAWMRFDDHQGTEKFWIVWSASPVKELDAVTGTVNEREKGEVSDGNQVKAVREFLDKHSSPKPEVAKDASQKLTTVKGKGDVLVRFIELEHH